MFHAPLRFQSLQLTHCVVSIAQSFSPAFTARTAPSTALFASRTNAKKEKIKRNRDNMRKFKTGGRRGLSRRKLLKKAQASKARQEEAEFIAQCFITAPPPNEDKN